LDTTVQGSAHPAEGRFDWVFIDSPPVVSLADAVILASMSDLITFINQAQRERQGAHPALHHER